MKLSSVAKRSVPVVTAKTSRIPVSINNFNIEAHYDGGSEISVIPYSVAKRTGLPITSRNKMMGMIGAGGQHNHFKGEMTVPIKFGDITTLVTLLVLEADDLGYELLLGKPYGISVRILESTNGDGSTDLLAYNDEGTTCVHYKYEPGKPSTNVKVSLAKSNHLIAVENALKSEFGSFKTKYKPVATKKRPVAKALDDGSIPYQWDTKVIEQDADHDDFIKAIEDRAVVAEGSRLTEERLNSIVIGKDDFLTIPEENLLRNVLLANEFAFSFKTDEIGLIKDEIVPPYCIKTVDHVPMVQKSFPLPRGMVSDVSRLLNDQLNNGMLEPSHGPYAVRWFCVRKATGKLRLIHDMQLVNAVTIRDACVPPIVEDIVERASGCLLFSVLDAHSGYDQRNLDVKSRDLTAFMTPMGLLRKTRSPQGATNSVADFQRSMVKIFQREVQQDAVSIFVDDVGVYPDVNCNFDCDLYPGIRSEVVSMARNLNSTLESAVRAGLTFSGEKTFVGVPEAIMVGHRVFKDGRTPADKHVRKINSWNRFESKTDVRGFVQLAGFFRMYIQNFAEIAEPLFLLLRKKEEFVWGSDQILAVDKLKKILTSYPILCKIDYENQETRPLIVNTDAGPVAGGGYLGQDDKEGRRRVNRYMSFTFTSSVRNYGQFKRELYAMVKNIKIVRYKIYGCRLIIETDCMPLIGFLNSPDLIDPVLVRWIAYLKLFNPEFRHIKGKDNVVSDALSRKQMDEPTSSDEEDILEGELGFSLNVVTNSTYTGEWLELLVYLKTLKKPREEMTTKEFEKLRKWSFGFFVLNDMLFRKSGKSRMPRRVLVTEEEKRIVLTELHDNNGHRGINGTYLMVKERYYWKGLYIDVKKYCETCHECQVRSRVIVQEPLRSWNPRTLDSIWFVDVVNMTEESYGYKYVILAREGLSGWVEATKLKRKRAKDWISFVDRDVISRYGCTTVVSDHGELDSKEMDDYCSKRGVKFLPVSEYNPRANVVERGHKPFVDGLAKAALKTKLGWGNDYLFNSALWADRVTLKRTTGFSPYYLRFGQDCILPVEIMLETWNVMNTADDMSTSDLLALRIIQLSDHQKRLEQGHEKLMKEKKRNAEYFNELKNTRSEGLKVGELVLLENTRVRLGMNRKLDPFWFGPYKVVEVIGNGTYRIAELDGVILNQTITGNRLISYRMREGMDVELPNYKEYEPDVEDSSDDEEGSSVIDENESSESDEEELIDFKNTERGLDGNYWSKPSARRL